MKPAAILLPLALSLLAGCSSYVNSPAYRSAAAEKRAAFSDPIIARAYNARPGIRFPATIAIATTDGSAREHIRALSATDKLDSLQSLPGIARTVTLSSLLVSNETREKKPDLALREAAARVQADAVLIVATETSATDGKIVAALSDLTLGLFPNKRYEIICTALAALVDTRTGYLYGALEKSHAGSGLTMAWGSDDVIARARSKAERRAVEKLFAEFPAFWRAVEQKHRR